MPSACFDSRARMRALRDGPACTLIEGFAQALSHTGYSAKAARSHRRAAEHLIAWMDRHGMPVHELNEQSLVEFGRHLGRSRRRPAGHPAGPNRGFYSARVFLNYLREAHIIRASAITGGVEDPVLLSAFSAWMRQQRGICQATLSNYGRHIREGLEQIGDEPSRWDAHGLRAFVLQKRHACGWGSVKTCTTALRMFVRFLIAEGRCTVGLDAAIPTVAHWRLAALPGYLQQDDVERVIASCNQASPVGRRNRAILLLLARLGLRAGDVAHLHLSDIDWKGASLLVCGKSRRQTRLPLTQEVGQAIVAYLQDGRPQAKTDSVFVCCRAPFGAFGHSAVSRIVDRALRCAGVTRPSRGAAHLLRHSVATSMLRHGASLQEIGAILRHRSVTTTQIYAKVDIPALQSIVQPWPEVPQC